MVSREIPPNYTNSPSSLGGAPQVTINRDITSFDLDSSNAFEGPEKLLEVWFTPSEVALPASASPLGLKAVPQASWREMLDLVNCKVLSVVASRNVDAYLLSESSMFVFPHKLVLKTCGTTTLLCGLPRMLEIAAVEAGFPVAKPASAEGQETTAASPHRIFYSRKNYLYPHQQRGPHRSWRDEVRYLDNMFARGSAYMIGKMNGEHWYLYITGPRTNPTPSIVPQTLQPDVQHVDAGDETLEILMTDLEESNGQKFYADNAAALAETRTHHAYEAHKGAVEHLGGALQQDEPGHTVTDTPTDDSQSDVLAPPRVGNGPRPDTNGEALSTPEKSTAQGHTLGSIVTETCGLADIYPQSEWPDARIDSYLFSPCGYSANGVVPQPGGGSTTHYWTVHVTPEPQCSYASFETNVPTGAQGRRTVQTVQQVVDVFRPGRFSVTLFETKSNDDLLAAHKDRRVDCIPGYRRVERIVHDLEGYELVFRYFERDDWRGGQPRLGEHF